jgi:UDP-N-acetylmuramate dehydrogenase
MMEPLSTNREIPLSEVISAFGPNLEFGVSLDAYTSYGTGGKARFFIIADTASEVVKYVKAAKRLKINHFLLGGGTNLLVSDDGFDGVAIKMDIRGLRTVEQATILCGAGENLMSLVNFATSQGLSGLEFAAGIWGSVGGAIYGNAGAFGGDIASILRNVTLIDHDGNERVEPADYCRFGYRDSHLKTSKEVIAEATFQLSPGNKDEIQARVDEILKLRDGKHPNDGMSAGCFFKNIPDETQPHGKLPAGKLLDEAGVKGMQVGGARVFDKHANIIVNVGGATSKDIRILADKMKDKVREKFGILLEEEVQQIGNF